MKILTLTLLISLCLQSIAVLAEEQQEVSKEQILLRKLYEMRMRHDGERAQKENAARANVNLKTGFAVADSPTVSSLRAQTNVQLSQFEQRFRCLDVDVDSNGGNTVVICGDNTGNIVGTNETVNGDKVTLKGE